MHFHTFGFGQPLCVQTAPSVAPNPCWRPSSFHAVCYAYCGRHPHVQRDRPRRSEDLREHAYSAARHEPVPFSPYCSSPDNYSDAPCCASRRDLPRVWYDALPQHTRLVGSWMTITSMCSQTTACRPTTRRRECNSPGLRVFGPSHPFVSIVCCSQLHPQAGRVRHSDTRSNRHARTNPYRCARRMPRWLSSQKLEMCAASSPIPLSHLSY